MTDVAAYAKAPQSGDIPSLTGLRIIAAVWVVMLHLQLMFSLELPQLQHLGGWTQYAFVAVDLFFVISGYVISHSYMPRRAAGKVNIPEFLARRLARIYPVHIVMFGIFVLFLAVARRMNVTLAHPEYYGSSSALQDIFLVRGWLSPNLGFNFPAWSLSAEWFSYLTAPLLFWMVLRFRVLQRRGSLMALLVGLCMLGFFFDVVAPSIDGMPAPLVRVSLGFGAGVLLHRLMTTFSWHRATMGYVATGGLFAMLVILPIVPYPPARAALALASGIAMVGGLAAGSGSLNRVLGTRLMQYGGKISFSLYMTHALFNVSAPTVLELLGVETWPTGLRIALVVATVVAVLAVAMAAYHLIERKGHNVVMRLYRTLAPAKQRRMDKVEG